MNSQSKANLTYPEKISSFDIELFVRGIHGHEEDFTHGDIRNRLAKFSRYVLTPLVLEKINPNEFEVHAPTAAIYADRLIDGEQAPPIVYDAEDGSIIDGLHRVNGAVQAGARSILSYVGFAENRCPNWSSE